ncbi:MAG TPA: hypothetical protein VKN37_01100 [Roseovarius sp.]|nr:hypothetical protein [Roseovarius sp.]
MTDCDMVRGKTCIRTSRAALLGLVMISAVGLSACENAGRTVAVGAAAGAAGSATAAAIRGDDVLENAAVGAATGAAAGLAGSFVASFF